MQMRLFHVTEFAHSMLSPADQREARQSGLLIVVGALWLALLCNPPLWKELFKLPMGLGTTLWIALLFALLGACALGLLLSLLNWPLLLRPLLTLLFWVCALNALLLWHGYASLRWVTEPSAWTTMWQPVGRIAVWRTVLVLAILALLPTVWIWRGDLRRMSVPMRISHNLLLALFFAGLLVAIWSVGRSSLLPLLQDQPRWLELLSPLNTLLTLPLRATAG